MTDHFAKRAKGRRGTRPNRNGLTVLATAASLIFAGPTPGASGEVTAEKQALEAVERCLTQHRDTPAQCQGAARSYCKLSDAAACLKFESDIWGRIAQAAERKLARLAGANADPAFVADAAADVQTRIQSACSRESAAAADQELAFWECKQRRLAARASAMWIIAQQD